MTSVRQRPAANRRIADALNSSDTQPGPDDDEGDDSESAA
jgi:hypothetical protein